MYFHYIGSYDCNYHFALVLIHLEFHSVLLIYLTFVIYVPEDGHMIGRNIYECIVCETLKFEYLCAFVVTITVLYIRLIHRSSIT